MKIVEDIKFKGIIDDDMIVDDEDYDWGIDDFAQSDETSSEIDDLKQKLYFDAVLGCQNRTKFEEDTKNIESPYTYFTLDANNLKFCNDKFSHEAGDTLLKVTAQIGMQVWDINNFYRTGGDEFAVLIKGVDQDTFICSEQLTKFKQLIAEEDKKYEFPIAVSVGFATSKDASSLEEVIKVADNLMYEDKRIYKEKFPQYDMRRAQLNPDTLREALKSDEFIPIVQETTEKAVKEAVKYHNDKLKLEVSEVLSDEVSYRLSKYEKRRRRRDFKEKAGSAVKGVVILLIVLFILRNQQLRLRFALVFQDIGDIVTDLATGEEASSNKLVYDLFKDLGDDINEVNTEESGGFFINEYESTEASEEVIDID